MENVGWTITFIVRIYYINTCCSLVVKFSNSIKDSFTSRVVLLFSIIFKFWKLEYFYWNLRNCKNLLHQQLLPPGGGILKLNYYKQMILTLWQYLHFLPLVFPDFFFLFRVCRFVYGILIFSRKIHNGAKSFMMLYQNFFYVSSI